MRSRGRRGQPGHRAAAVVARFVHFQGDLSYAAGFSVFQLAWHIVIFTSAASMIFSPIGGVIARRRGARLPMIIGTVSCSGRTPARGGAAAEAPVPAPAAVEA